MFCPKDWKTTVTSKKYNIYYTIKGDIAPEINKNFIYL